jgi:hypothetical protein
MSAITLSALVKDAIGNMPDTLNSKKEIDEYYKKVMKDINDKKKEDKKANKEGSAPRKALAVKTAPKKRVKKADVDSDGNEIEKVKKPTNAYQQFIKDNRQKVKDENPGLSNEDYFRLLASNWQKHKDAMKDNKDSDLSTEEKDKEEEKEEEKDKEEEKEEEKKEDKEEEKSEITVEKEDKKKDKKGNKEKKGKKEGL